MYPPGSLWIARLWCVARWGRDGDGSGCTCSSVSSRSDADCQLHSLQISIFARVFSFRVALSFWAHSELKQCQERSAMQQKTGAAAGIGLRRSTSTAPTSRRWIPPSPAVAPLPAAAPSAVAPSGPYATTSAAQAGSPSASPDDALLSRGARMGFRVGTPPDPSSCPGGARLYNAPTAAMFPSTTGPSFFDLLQSFEGIMSCMMIQPHNQPKNAHFIGHLGHTLNNPINIQVKMLMKKMRWRWS